MSKTTKRVASTGKGSQRAYVDSIVNQILDDVRFNRADGIVMIAVPSHDRNNKPLEPGMQSRWARAAMDHFGDLFVGATAMPECKGIYKEDGNAIWDDPILVQSFCPISSLQDERIVRSVVEFALEMRREMDQLAVMVVFNNLMKFIEAKR